MRQLNAAMILSSVLCLGVLPSTAPSVRGAPPVPETSPPASPAPESKPAASVDSVTDPATVRPASVRPTDSIWKSGYQLVEYLSRPGSRAKRKPDLKIAQIENGSSASDTRSLAIAALPLQKLNGDNRERVQDVLDRLSLFRRMPTISLEIDPIMYRFFAQHPDVAVSVWRAMDISTFQMQQKNAIRYQAKSSDGTSGVIDVIYRTSNDNNSECVAICDGWYRPVLPLKPIKAVAILHLETSFTATATGTPLVTHRVDMFVSFPSQTVASASKIVSPITNPIIDRNFVEISRFMKMMSTAMALRPGWVELIGNQLDGVLPARKQQFLEIAARVYVRTRHRNRQQSMQPAQKPKPSLGSPAEATRPTDNSGRGSTRRSSRIPRGKSPRALSSPSN